MLIMIGFGISLPGKDPSIGPFGVSIAILTQILIVEIYPLIENTKAMIGLATTRTVPVNIMNIISSIVTD